MATAQERAQAYLEQSSTSSRPNPMLRNSEWLQASFISPGILSGRQTTALSETDRLNRRFTSASYKYTDASIGGNLCLNPPPQFTRYADIRDQGMRVNSVLTNRDYAGGDTGMGRYYSEAIDDNMQIIHMRMGVPEYNSLLQFFTGFYDSGAAMMARSGRANEGFIHKMLRWTGNAIGMLVAPLMIIPWAIMMVGQMARFFLKWPASKFYYLKPAMPLFHLAFGNMVNQISTNTGVTSFYKPETMDNIIGEEHKFSATEMRQFKSLLPDIIDENGVINVYAISNKAKRLQMRHEKMMDELFKNGSGKDFYGIVRTVLDNRLGIEKPAAGEYSNGTLGIETYLQKWFDGGGKLVDAVTDAISSGVEKMLRINKSGGEPTEETGYQSQDVDDGFFTFLNAEEADGSGWLSLRVENTGAASESFSSSFSQNSLAQTINSASSSARSMRINMADGNFDPAGITQMVVDGVKTILTGVADTLMIGGLMAAAGNAFVDIPDYWDNASASFNKTSYKLSLVCPYNNPVYKLLYQYIPMCAVLAAGMPLSTGKQSYTAPFMLELYDRGRGMTRLGMIESISISRGTGNIGFNNDGQPMGIEVTFSIKDMSNVIAMPIQPGFSIFKGIFDSENAFTDYMMVLAGMKLKDVVSRWAILKYQLTTARAELTQATSAAYWAANLASTLPGRILGSVMRGTDKE